MVFEPLVVWLAIGGKGRFRALDGAVPVRGPDPRVQVVARHAVDVRPSTRTRVAPFGGFAVGGPGVPLAMPAQPERWRPSASVGAVACSDSQSSM